MVRTIHHNSKYVDKEYSIVEAVELLQVWCRASKVILRRVQLLGRRYFMMSSTHLDEFCEWVHDKRRLCCDEAEFRVTMLTDPCIDSSHFKYSMDAITYNPVCRDWQISRCNSLGLNFHYGNNPHHGAARNEMIGISQRPIRTGRISADGNCFFRCISFIITGSQDYHEELRLLVWLTIHQMTSYRSFFPQTCQCNHILHIQRCSHLEKGLQKSKSLQLPAC